MSTSQNGPNAGKNGLQKTNNPASATPDEGRSAFSSSTTQGEESNAGKGGSQLGGESYQQDNQTAKTANDQNDTTKQASPQPLGGTRQGSGAKGYDADREQQPANQERDDINTKRNEEQADIEQTSLDPDQRQTPGNESNKPGLH